MCAGTGGRVHPTDRARKRLPGARAEVDARRPLHRARHEGTQLEIQLFRLPIQSGSTLTSRNYTTLREHAAQERRVVEDVATAVKSTADQACRADSIITVYKEMFPDVYNREDTATAAAPSAEVLRRLARLREEPESDDGSTADERARVRGAGWVGTSKPMQIGSGYTRRNTCDGQSLASPGRWPVEHRTYPEDETWRLVSDLHRDFSCRVGTPALLPLLLDQGDPEETRCGREPTSRSQHFPTKSKTLWTTKAGEDRC